MEINHYRLGLTSWAGIPVFVLVVQTKDVDLPTTAPDDPDRATSKAQVKWAQWQLKRVDAGLYAPCSMERLKALASTPMAGLPERKTPAAKKGRHPRASARS